MLTALPAGLAAAREGAMGHVAPAGGFGPLFCEYGHDMAVTHANVTTAGRQAKAPGVHRFNTQYFALLPPHQLFMPRGQYRKA